jgi:hypothetical protein
MPEIKFEKEKLDQLLAEVGNELAAMIKAEGNDLEKSAKDDAPGEASEGSAGPTEPDGDADDMVDAAPAEGSASDMPPEESPGEAHNEPEAAAAEAAEEQGQAPGEEAMGQEQAPSVEELQAEYSKLDPEALKMHYLAAKSALMAAMGQDQAQAPAPEASAPAAAPTPPAPAPAGAPMAMGEKKAAKAMDYSNGNSGGEMKAGKMGKSEKDVEIEALKAQLEEQNQALLQLAEVVATPIRKSVKGLSDLRFIERTEETKVSAVAKLTKAEVMTKLRERVREGKLSKSDKDLISQYTVGGGDAAKIEHLLADAK